MHTIVIFNKLGARIKKVADISEYKDEVCVAIDPDLKEVRRIPPHFWKLEAGKILPMTDEEKNLRVLLMTREKEQSQETPAPPQQKIEEVKPTAKSKKPLLYFVILLPYLLMLLMAYKTYF